MKYFVRSGQNVQAAGGEHSCVALADVDFKRIFGRPSFLMSISEGII